MAQPCSGNPCQHGTCDDFGDVRYQCTCHEGYTGTNCDTDISKLTPYHAESCYVFFPKKKADIHVDPLDCQLLRICTVSCLNEIYRLTF